MASKRVYKIKNFSKWANGLVSDSDLCVAASELEQGIHDGYIGGGVYKKRVAYAGMGKSGSGRTLASVHNPIAIFFLIGRSKNESGADFSQAVQNSTKAVAKVFCGLTNQEIADLLKAGQIEEICHECNT